ncbi:MAG TPA: S8/S53 family peptidase, partial [Chitinophagales bacterium]
MNGLRFFSTKKAEIKTHICVMWFVRKTVFLFSIFNCCLAFSQNTFVVSLKDKNQNAFSISHPQEFLSQKSIERRAKQNIAITENDLPVSRTYIQQLKNAGAEILLVSKWLNLLVVRVDSITQITNVSCVKSIQQIHETTNTQKKLQRKFEMLQTKSTKAFDANSYYGNSAWQNEMLNVQYLHERGYKGDSVHIAMFDSGWGNANNIEGFDSLFLQNRVLDTWDYVSGNDSVFQIPNDDTHGTATLSCIAANEPGVFVGTAPNAMFSLYHTENTNSETIQEEYNWIAAAEHADSLGAQLFSTSLGYTTFDNDIDDHNYGELTGDSTLMTKAANAAAHAGIVVVNSAGNEGDNSWHYITVPADGDSVIAVGAVDGNKLIADFSSRGPNATGRIKPDVSAPGVNVSVYDPSGEIFGSNGTSHACPILAGAIACLMQAFPQATNVEIKNAVIESASKFKSPDNYYGYGIPDFGIAYWLLNEKYPKPENDNTFRVYPNPFRDELTIYLQKSAPENLKIELFDISGKRAFSQGFSFTNNKQFMETLNLSSLEKGVYILRVKGKTTDKIQRV